MSRAQEALDFAAHIKAMGFRVWLAERGPYGFISDKAGERVLSFSFNDGSSLSGNYGPPSQESGTGWRLDETPSDLRTVGDVAKALGAYPPTFCGKGWKHLTTVKQHLEMYGTSSRYREI